MQLSPGQVHNLGPIAGTGSNGAIAGIGAVDLGEIVELPDGSYVAVFGDSFSGHRALEGDWHQSVAVPVAFDEAGRPRFGAPLNGPVGSHNPLFRPPQQSLDPHGRSRNTLPAGSIQVDGATFMMVVGTTDLRPEGGSWLVRVTDDPATGWRPVEGSWRPRNYAHGGQSQISGYQGSDGDVYIATDSFDRSKGVTLYRADPNTCTDRSTWQPYVPRPNGTARWGAPGTAGRPISGPQQRFGELSFREIDGHAVLSGFNSSPGLDRVEVRVAGGPTDIFRHGRTTVVAQQHDVPQNYGGYIVPGSTLADLRILVSQWNTNTHTPYNVQEFRVRPALP